MIARQPGNLKSGETRLANCCASWLEESFLELRNVEEHVHGVELNIDVKLIVQRHGDIGLDRGLYVESRTERPEVPWGPSDVYSCANFGVFSTELITVAPIELVSEDACITEDRQSGIGNHADGQQLISDWKLLVNASGGACSCAALRLPRTRSPLGSSCPARPFERCRNYPLSV